MHPMLLFATTQNHSILSAINSIIPQELCIAVLAITLCNQTGEFLIGLKQAYVFEIISKAILYAAGIETPTILVE